MGLPAMGGYCRGVALAALAVSCAGLTFCGGETFVATGDQGADAQAGDAPGADVAAADGAADGAVEGAAADGSVVGDARVDGYEPGDAVADAPPFDGALDTFSCATPPLGTIFCANFDDVNKVSDTWTSFPTFGNGSNAFDTIDYVSAPHGYSTFASSNGSVSGASLGYTFASTKPLLIYSFSTFVKSLSLDATITIANLAVGDRNQGGNPFDLAIQVLVESQGLHLLQTIPSTTDSGTADEDDDLHVPIVFGKWVRVRIELDRGAVPALRVFIDGAKVFDNPPYNPVLGSVKGAEVDLGMILVPSGKTGAISYDDALVRGI